MKLINFVVTNIREFCVGLHYYKRNLTLLYTFEKFNVMRKSIFTIVLLLSVFSYIEAQVAVRQKDKWGTQLYYVENNTIYLKDRWGAKLCYLDGNTVKMKDRWGDKLFYIDGNTVRQKDQWGEKLLYFDGNKIRQKDQWGTVLYYIDGNTIRLKDQWGDKVFYFDGLPEKWVIACIVL